jgi:hypothetical protein
MSSALHQEGGVLALKAKADIIYTWNVKHYGQFGSEATKRVRTP